MQGVVHLLFCMGVVADVLYPVTIYIS